MARNFNLASVDLQRLGDGGGTHVDKKKEHKKNTLRMKVSGVTASKEKRERECVCVCIYSSCREKRAALSCVRTAPDRNCSSA